MVVMFIYLISLCAFSVVSVSVYLHSAGKLQRLPHISSAQIFCQCKGSHPLPPLLYVDFEEIIMKSAIYIPVLFSYY